MAYLKLKYVEVPLQTLLEAVSLLDTVEVGGDWWEYKLGFVRQVGLPMTSAPAQTIFSARERLGEKVCLELRLANGRSIFGCVGGRGLLLSSKSLHQEEEEIESDLHISEFCHRISSVTDVLMVEFG